MMFHLATATATVEPGMGRGAPPEDQWGLVSAGDWSLEDLEAHAWASGDQLGL